MKDQNIKNVDKRTQPAWCIKLIGKQKIIFFLCCVTKCLMPEAEKIEY